MSLLRLIEDHWPNVLLEPFGDLHAQRLYAHTHPALFSYFVARQSAQFSHPLDMEAELSDDLVHAIAQQTIDLNEADAVFDRDGDFNRRYGITLTAAGDILNHLARLVGHRHGLDEYGLEPDSPIAPFLERLELTKWLGLLEEDLARLWLHRGAWPSFTVFSDFSAHTKRLLWQFGAMSWRVSDEEF